MSENLHRWVQQLDRIAQNPLPGHSHAMMDMMPWCTYLAFDVIGDLAFGASFGMVAKGRDECESQPHPDGPITITTGAETLNRRGEVSSALGLLPALRPFAKYLPDPFFSKGLQSVSNLQGIAEVAVSRRLELAQSNDSASKNRRDILQMLVEAKDASGQPMPRQELLSEALTELIAGSDTVSNTACAIFYWILDAERKAPGTIVPRLRAELDAAIPADADIALFSQVKNLPFLRRCIDEAMRLHSTSAIGLPRIVTAPEGITYNDRVYSAGTVLSVPSYTIHHDSGVWGDDVEEFKPDRWLKENLTPRQALCFNPFSYGPRACVGQNVARMELSLIVGTAFHRYDFELYQETLESHEGFSKKPDECWLGISRR
jgi:benzoate 4-monooxygenase